MIELDDPCFALKLDLDNFGSGKLVGAAYYVMLKKKTVPDNRKPVRLRLQCPDAKLGHECINPFTPQLVHRPCSRGSSRQSREKKRVFD